MPPLLSSLHQKISVKISTNSQFLLTPAPAQFISCCRSAWLSAAPAPHDRKKEPFMKKKGKKDDKRPPKRPSKRQQSLFRGAVLRAPFSSVPQIRFIQENIS